MLNVDRAVYNSDITYQVLKSVSCEYVSCHLDVVDTKKRSHVSQMGSTLRQEKIKICAACVLLLAFLNQL